MSRVEWTRRAPEEIESVLAILLCRENPAAERVRPARGDRGIDVFVPTPDGWIVYQVKSFTESLTSSHKRQIKKSWMRFLEFIDERKLKVKEWYCIRPLNATIPDRDWLAELTGDPAFPRAWKGLDFCEGLVAKFPDVVDYYLFDGKEQLRKTIEVFLRAAGFAKGAADVFHPSDALPTLETLHAALNKLDPHYYFDFSVDTVPPGAEPPVPQPADNLVASAIRRAGDQAVTFRIFARFKEATTERPVPGTFTPSAEPGSPEAKAWEDFLTFGVPVEALPVTAMSLELPGGLGATAEDGLVNVGPAQLDGARPFDLHVAVIDAAGTELASAVVRMDSPTIGVTGGGIGLHGTEAAGVFDLDLRIRPAGEALALSLHSRDFTGAPPADVLPGLRLLAVCQPPHLLHLSLRNGPSLGEQIAIPEQLPGSAQRRRVIRVCEALAAIQRVTPVQITVPDLTQTTNDEARAWIEAAQLLGNETFEERWTDAHLTFNPEATLPAVGDGPAPIEFAVPLKIVIGGKEVELGVKKVHLLSASVAEVDTEHRVVVVEAGEDDRARYSLGSLEDVS